MNTHESFKRQMMEETPFLPVYKCLLQRYTAQESSKAILLSYLIDADDYATIRLTDDDSFFECTTSFIQSVLNWSEPTIIKQLTTLMNDGFISIRNVPVSGGIKRFIKINQVALINLNDEYRKQGTKESLVPHLNVLSTSLKSFKYPTKGSLVNNKNNNNYNDKNNNLNPDGFITPKPTSYMNSYTDNILVQNNIGICNTGF